jgi:secreted trypsin-like serine protease
MNVIAALTLPSLAVASNIFVHDEIQPRIVGGFPGGIGAYPYFCHAVTNNSVCGGTLIAADIVLTVKACENVFQDNEVFIGSNDRLGRDFAPRITVSSLQIHPTEDLMLVLLNETSNNVLVSLNLDETPVADRPLFTIGFGRSTEEDPAFSDSLMEVDMFLLENGICRLQVGDLFNETTQYCASFPFGGPCDGDEGAPLLDLITQVQSGVYSYNIGCTNQPSVYVRLSAYADWITDFVCSNSTLAPEELCGVTSGNKGKKSKKSKKSKSSSNSKKSVTSKSSKKGTSGKGKGGNDSIDDELEDDFYMNSTHHFLNETHFHNATAHNKTRSSKKSFKKGEQQDFVHLPVTRTTHQQRTRRKRRQIQYPRIRGGREALP